MLSNNVTLIGNLGSDINIRQTKAGQPYGYVNLAVTRYYTPKQGEKVKETQWFRLVAWGTVATRMEAELATGSRILVEGRLTTRSFETKDGQRREVVEINVANFSKLERRTPLAESSAAQETEAAPAF